MNVFISWSGDLSRRVAQALCSWLPDVLQAVRPWMSQRNIASGARWADEVYAHLDAPFAILCITAGNMNEPWIHFEAGSLAAKQPAIRVCPVLIGATPDDLSPPLSHFQAVRFGITGLTQLVTDINRLLPEGSRLTDRQLESALELRWPALSKLLHGREVDMQWLGDDLISPFERDAPSFQQSVLQSLARIEESAPTLTSQLRAVQESLKGATIGYGIALAISDEVRLNRQAVDILSVVAKGHRPAVLALAELAAHYECDIAQNAADGLRQIGLPDISQVINELGAALDAHGDIWPLYECLKQLGEAGARIVAEHVMSDPGHDFAVRALGEMGRVAHGVQEKVAALLDDHRVLPFLQSGLIIDTLMRIEADAVVVVPRLIKLLPLADYRLSATLALPHWGTDAGGAGDALLDNLVAADNELHEATVKALESVRPLRPSTESRLQDLMSSSNPNVASAAGRLLGQQ